MLKPVRRLPPSLIRRLAADRDGLAAIEFAMIAPLLVLIYFGLAELSSAIIASRHVNHSTSALGDLVAQCANLSDSDLSNMINASTDIITPLPLSTMTQTVTSVIDNNGVTQVQWSRQYVGSTNTIGAGAAPGTNVSVPTNVVSSNGDTVIVTETVYNYKFPFSPNSNTIPLNGQSVSINFVNGITFDVLSYFKPRKSTQVTYTGVTGSGGTNSQTSCYGS